MENTALQKKSVKVPSQKSLIDYQHVAQIVRMRRVVSANKDVTGYLEREPEMRVLQ